MIEVGEYIRTKKGLIGMVIKIGEGKCINKYRKYLIDWGNSKATYRTAIKDIKHSKNIIDLIEVGDYVNGNKVMTMCYEKKEGVEHTINFELDDGQVYSWKEKIGEETHDFQLKIETILTYEIYEREAYKIE